MGRLGIFFWGSGKTRPAKPTWNRELAQVSALSMSGFLYTTVVYPTLSLAPQLLYLLQKSDYQQKNNNRIQLFSSQTGEKANYTTSPFLLLPPEYAVNSTYSLSSNNEISLVAVFWKWKHITHWASTYLETFEIGATGGDRLRTSVQLTGAKQWRKEGTNYSPKVHLLVVADLLACPNPARPALESFPHWVHDQLHAYTKQDSFRWCDFPGWKRQEWEGKGQTRSIIILSVLSLLIVYGQ